MSLTREQTVALARSQIGVRENPPGSNRVLYSIWYGLIGPWCAMFVSWIMWKAGVPWYRFASTATSVAAARRAGKLVPVSSALPGDCLVRLYTTTTGHTGIATTRGGTRTVEGNTNLSGSRTGGQVLENARPAGYWQYCIRLDYPTSSTPAPTPPEDDEMTDPERALLATAAQKATDAVNYAVAAERRLVALEAKMQDGVNYDVDAQGRLAAVEAKVDQIIAKLGS